MKILLFFFSLSLFMATQINAQDLTQNYRKLILNSSNSTSLFQSTSTNGVWGSGTVTADRWGVFEDATSSKERLTILPGGNIGIGTITPQAKLDINGNVKVTAPGGQWITGKTGSGGITSNTQLSNTAYHPLIRQKTAAGHIVNIGGLGDYFGFFGFDKNRTTNGHDHSLIMNLNTGNIGVGITNPQAKLDVNGNIKVTAPGGQWITGKTGSGGITSNTQLSNAAYHPLIRQKTATGHVANIGGLGDFFGFFGFDKNRTTNGLDHSLIMNLNTGNIGIETTNPKEKLQIGNAFTFHDGGHEVIGFQYAANGAVDLDNTKYAGEVRFDPVLGNLRFGTSSSVTNGPSSHVFINKNGNVGIGTYTSNSKFAIDTGNTDLNMQGDGGVYGYGINVNTTGGWARNYSFSSNGTARAHMGALGNNNSLTYLYFDTNATHATGYHNPEMVIKSDGNVGIGTKVPDSKLTVAGNIHAREVKVTVNAGADFVFAKDYNLPTLKALEKYIIKNKHLPEIASEKEMQEDGLLLAEMNIKLLQKIEELTLYTIQQEKRIVSLEKENKTLKKQDSRIDVLEQQLAELLAK